MYLDNKPEPSLFLTPQIQSASGSHNVMTGVYQPTKKKYVNMDTRFQSSVSTEEVVLTLPERIHNMKSVFVRSMEIPISFYNFSASFGNQTLFVFDPINHLMNPIVLPDQWYSTIQDVIRH